jgi:hypothetical protein
MAEITRSEVELIVELGNEKVKGEIMERVIHNEGSIGANKDDVGEIKTDIKAIMNILRTKDKVMIATLVSSIVTVITLMLGIILFIL